MLTEEKLPKLKISRIFEQEKIEEIKSFDEGKYIVFAQGIVLAEGQRVVTIEELENVVLKHKNKRFVKVVVLPIEVAAGG